MIKEALSDIWRLSIRRKMLFAIMLMLAVIAFSPAFAFATGPDANIQAAATPSTTTSSISETSTVVATVVSPASDPAGANGSAVTKLAGSDHVQDVGTTQKAAVGQGTALELGSTGQAKRLEGFSLEAVDAPAAGASVEYSAHVQDVGWQESVKDGSLAGTQGEAKRVEAVKIELTGDLANALDVWYRAHVQNIGWMGWTKNGEAAGTTGRGLRLEALQVELLEKGINPTGYDATVQAFSAPTLIANAHVQNIGWSGNQPDPAVIGTTGRTLRLEALQLSLGEGTPAAGSIEYSVHVQNIGWQAYVKDGVSAGTTDQGLRIEAIKIKLTGAIADAYSIYYSAHVANIGWLGWAKDDAIAGTTASSINLEAIKIQFVKKNGGVAPTSNVSISYLAPSMFTASVDSISRGATGWASPVNLGEISGTVGKATPLLGISIEQTSNSSWPADLSGHINYATHLSDIGWTSAVSDGAKSGNLSTDNRVEAFLVALSGDISKYFDIYYRAHVSDAGWLGWASNGDYAGSTGLSKNVEAIQVNVTVKGGAAPGSTANAFSDQNGFLSPIPAFVRAMLNRAQGFSSDTDHLILVDTDACNIAIFRGSQNDWSVDTYDACVCGAEESPTVTGTYTTGYTLDCLPAYPNAQYCTHIVNGYFFHSVLESTDELGQHLSHGCVRLAWWLAQYIQSLPEGSTVNLY